MRILKSLIPTLLLWRRAFKVLSFGKDLGEAKLTRFNFSCVLFLLIIFFSSFSGFLKNTTELFNQANQYYKEKNFDAAIQLYDSVAEMGLSSAELYFNLGNAWFKKGKVAPAILNYERAKKINPSDEDIEFNLKIANLRVADRIDAVPELFFVRWFKNLIISQSSDGWAVFAIGLVWVAFVFGVLFIFIQSFVVKRLSFFLGLLALLFSLSCAGVAYSQYNFERNSQSGIVFVTNAYVKSSPDPESPDLFMLREGVKVELLGSEGDWKRIRLADGKVGWIFKDNVVEI